MEGGYFEESKMQNMIDLFHTLDYVIISNVFIQRAFSEILQCKSIK